MATSPPPIFALRSRLDSLVDDRLFQAYWTAVAHFNTTDLVVFFDERIEEDPVTVSTREELVTADGIPKALREKLGRPAREVAGCLSSAETAFWFVADFADGETVYGAIRAKLIGPTGNA